MHETVIRLDGVSKCYRSYTRDVDRMLEVITGRPRHHAYYALHPLTLEVATGEVIGLVGKNGAGKSTLLKLLAGTLQPSTGAMQVNGRISAILELGASFHPEMSGHDNVYLTCAIQGLSREETAAAYDTIVSFAGIGEFMQRPVKTYSSGMTMRLAFAIATNVNPDILIIDEALAVGDGVFARRSFDRIMEFRKAGKTIFFCSHSLYQVEALCDRVLWLDEGRVRSEGKPAQVITEYGEFLRHESAPAARSQNPDVAAMPQPIDPTGEVPKILDVAVKVDGKLARIHKVMSNASEVEISVKYQGAAGLPPPSIGLIWMSGDGLAITSMGSRHDGVTFPLDDNLQGTARVVIPSFPLLKGQYFLDVYLLGDEGIHVYEMAREAAEFNVEQPGLELGFFSITHKWQ